MAGLFEKGLLAGLGLLDLSQEKAEKFVNEMVKRGQVARKDADRLLRQVIRRGLRERRELEQRVQDGVRKALAKVDVATTRELARLEKRVAGLEEKLAARKTAAK